MPKSEASRRANRAYKARQRQTVDGLEKLREERREYMARCREKPEHRDKTLRRRYGISHEQYVEMFARQCGRCAVCRKELLAGLDTCVDHCHKTGKVRGLLCRKCNLALGHLDDDIQRITALAEYLRLSHMEGGDL